MVLNSEDVHLVDDMATNLKQQDENNLEDGVISNTLDSIATPIVSVSDPIDEAINVPVNNSIIITFNVAMDEETVNNAISVFPYFDHYKEWDGDSKILVIEPHINFQNGTVYTLYIDRTARAFFNHENLEEEIEISFTTVS